MIFAYLDDMYVKTTDMHVIGAEAWKGEGIEEERGLVVLGVPVGLLADKEGSHSQNPSGEGRTVRVAAPLDVCWTQGGLHSPQLAPFRGDTCGLVLQTSTTWRLRPVGRPGQVACHRSMPVHHRSSHVSPGVGRAAVKSTVCGKPKQQKACRCHGHPVRAPQPVDPEVGEWIQWLAISRICCSRHPLYNLRAFATCLHGPPSFAGITTGPMRFEALHLPLRTARRPVSRRKSSGRCSSSVRTCSSTWMTNSANTENG